MTYMMDFYFESAAMILTLITVGKTLEARSKGKTTDALKGLMKLAPKDRPSCFGTEQEVDWSPWSRYQKDDVFVVRPGESIPVDGVVLEGTSAVNEAALTGESIPTDKGPGRQACPPPRSISSGYPEMPRHSGRRGHHPFSDHSDGIGCCGDQSAHRQDRR